jgi:hypothetical protein
MNKATIILIVFFIMFIPGLFVFQLYKHVLKSKLNLVRFERILLGFGLIGIIFAIFNKFNNVSLAFLLASISPSIHWLFFVIYLNQFIKQNGREPKDVVLNFNTGLYKDRFFAMSFVLVSIFGSMAMIGYFIWRIRNN